MPRWRAYQTPGGYWYDRNTGKRITRERARELNRQRPRKQKRKRLTSRKQINEFLFDFYDALLGVGGYDAQPAWDRRMAQFEPPVTVTINAKGIEGADTFYRSYTYTIESADAAGVLQALKRAKRAMLASDSDAAWVVTSLTARGRAAE